MSNKPNSYNSLIIKGARQHNLKSVSVEIPHGSFTVVTGVSGSGKTSLVFDTIYAEGQRRYVESLSSYARQFLGRMPKPEVDVIEGLAPAIAIEQKIITRNPRSTVATATEIYDYLKLLFTRLGSIYSPVSGEKVIRQRPEDVWNFVAELAPNTSIIIMSKLKSWNNKTVDVQKEIESVKKRGFVRLYHKNEGVVRLDKLEVTQLKSLYDCYLIIDRLALMAEDDEMRTRFFDSVENAFWEGSGKCSLLIEQKDGSTKIRSFADVLEKDGILFQEPDLNNMSFNSPAGACQRCEGLGEINDIDPDLVIPDITLSVFDNCVVPWKGEVMSVWKQHFLKQAVMDDFPIHRAYKDLTEEQKQYLWNGTNKAKGIFDFFAHLEEKSYKIQYRVMLSRYRGRTICTECKGTKLRKEATYVKLVPKKKFENLPDKVSLMDILLMPVEKAYYFFKEVEFEGIQNKAVERVLTEIRNRLEFLYKTGLGYLTLHRMSNTLSGGESQRVRLATSLGSSLSGSIYVLDEPSIGLHPRDTLQLIEVLKDLQKKNNTVIVVEHEEEMMKAADYIIDIGPLAGTHGGEVVFAGNFNALTHATNSLTADYLTGKICNPIPAFRRKAVNMITVKGAHENNLKYIDVSFPIGTLTVVTGVSGSGKTTLVKKILYPALQKKLGLYSGIKTGRFLELTGKYDLIKGVELIDQNPLGRSSRSNPVTFVKAWDVIRDLFAEQSVSKNQKYKPSFFSFNVEGGRCEHCKGDGVQTIEMQFMADIVLPCEFCHGKRFKDEVLEVEYKGKNVAEVLEMTVDEAMIFFEDNKTISEKLLPLQKVGLGYIKLGQSSNTLSGGEAQRVKLASFLGKGHGSQPLLFIFDEPTTGLHFHDISKLLGSLNALIEKGHSVIVIEHNPDMIKCADYVIDLGPEGGDKGGNLVFAGTPEELANCKSSYTGKFVSQFFNKNTSMAQ
ncbi:MAG: excinuclease ABC subunit UvrA [Bacteroidia bacterium]|nr:excinuclease ABC subunit UvrA [Bacteroidia bacterium]